MRPVCSPYPGSADKMTGLIGLLVGVLLSLNIRLDYLKNVQPFSTASYFGYSCIGPHLLPLVSQDVH